MNASQFRMMCRFEGGKPGLYFRDHIRDLDMLRQAETRKVTRRSYLNYAGLSRPIS